MFCDEVCILQLKVIWPLTGVKSQIRYSPGIGPEFTWTAFWLSSHTKLKLYIGFIFNVRIVKIFQFDDWLLILRHATEGHITELLLCVGWLAYTGSAVRGYLMRQFWITIAVWLVFWSVGFLTSTLSVSFPYGRGGPIWFMVIMWNVALCRTSVLV